MTQESGSMTCRARRRSVATSLFVALLALSTTTCSAPERATPLNLILIGADDLAFHDMGFMGSEHVQTPNLDRLAAEGTVLTHGQHAASLCRPSLRALLTGVEPYQWQRRIVEIGRPGYEMLEFDTLPRLLADAGYTSFQAGKIWEAGFAVAGFTSGMHPPGEPALRGGRGATLGRESIQPAVDFLEDNTDHPFFLWFFPKLPHKPHDAGPEYERRYEGQGLSKAAVAYYANITRFDDAVGKLLTRLDELDLTRRTLVVFLTDNGWELAIPSRPGAPSRGPRGKRTLHEIGFRTPIVLRLPGRIEAGRRFEQVVSTLDLLPTLLAYAGLTAPAGRAGVDLAPLLERGSEPARDAVIGWMGDLRPLLRPGPQPHSGFFLRNRDWRYIWYPEVDHDELYEIRRDPSEESDASDDHPDLVRAFRERIRTWEIEMQKPAR